MMQDQGELYWNFGAGAGNWVFGALCLVIGLLSLRMIVRERITLQGSISYLAFLFVLGVMAAFPDATGAVAHALGFAVMSNFFFCTAIALLALLHLRALVTLSTVQLRSVALTQELAILQERIDRAERAAGHGAVQDHVAQ